MLLCNTVVDLRLCTYQGHYEECFQKWYKANFMKGRLDNPCEVADRCQMGVRTTDSDQDGEDRTGGCWLHYNDVIT